MPKTIYYPPVRQKFLPATALAMLLTGVALPAIAQDDGDPNRIELDTVTITAAKDGDAIGGPNLSQPSTAGSHLGLSSFETPASIDVVKAETLRRSNPRDLNRALVENSVGLSYSGGHGGGGTAIMMRGFSGQNSVTRLYDGIRLLPASASVSFPFDSWTIDRVEVLHGPAAVLYGVGGIGGAINFVPKRPLWDGQRNEARITYGTNNTMGLALGSAGAINQHLAYSLDMNVTRSEGEREGNDSRSFAVSGALEWKATDTLSVTASLDYGVNKPDTYFGTPLIDGKIDERIRWVNYNATDAEIRYKDGIAQVQAVWAPSSNITVRNTLYGVYSNRYWRNIENSAYNPATGMVDLSGYIAVRHHHQQYGNRLDVTFDNQMGGVEVTTLAGIDLTRIKFENRNSSPYATPGDAVSVVDLLDPIRGPFGTHPMKVTTETDTKRASVFADTKLKFSDSLSVVAGVHFDRTDFTNNVSGISGDFSSVNGRVGAVWNPSPDIAVYGQLSYAEESLGNLLTLSATHLDQKLTTGRQAEIGIKAHLPDQRGQAILSAYHIEQRNLTSRDPEDRDRIMQIGQVSSAGIEAAISYDLGAGVTVHADAALIRAKYDEFLDKSNDYSGHRKPNIPSRVVNLRASWDINDDWQLRGGLHHVGAAYTDSANTVTRPSYTVVNAGVQWRATDRAVMDLNVVNLTDRVYANNGGRTQMHLAPGRTVNLSVHMDF